MKKLLVINASARVALSNSRKLTQLFVEKWEANTPDSIIKYRELGTEQVPHITENWIAGAFGPEEQRTEEQKEALLTSDLYVNELLEADVIVIGAPMYNWSIPSTLKAYLDQVIRVNKTWWFDPNNTAKPINGLLKNKTLYLLVATGNVGYDIGGQNEHLNYQSNYLKMVFNIIGIDDIHVVSINGESFDLQQYEQSIKNALSKVEELVALEAV
jgi:FMN-dependent NADH-azoreductase